MCCVEPGKSFHSPFSSLTSRPRHSPRNAAVVTFDDGYVDNLTEAKPSLAKAGLLGDGVLATGFLNQRDEFWWDELARLIFLGAELTHLAITVRDKTMRFDLDDNRSNQSRGWRAGTKGLARFDRKPTTIWRTLRDLRPEERDPAMAQIRSALAQRLTSTGSGRPMTSAEVRSLVSDGLIAIGAHTVTHPVLTELPASDRIREITESRITCGTLSGSEVRTFAYPFGSAIQPCVPMSSRQHLRAVVRPKMAQRCPAAISSRCRVNTSSTWMEMRSSDRCATGSAGIERAAREGAVVE